MSSRLEIELTSARPDGSFTWRKAGAKQPKGEISAELVPSGSSPGDILKVDADIAIDGIDILTVVSGPPARKEKNKKLEILGSGKTEELVTTRLAKKGGGRQRGGGRGRDGDERGSRGDRRPRGDSRQDRGGGGRGDGDRKRSPKRERKPRADAPSRPKPKRLRPTKTHRNAVLEQLPPEQRPIAEQVLRGGVPAVRKEIEKQNEQNKAAGMPEIAGDQLVVMAENLLPALRAAEWRDRADSALRLLDEIDLRDLRSVIVAAEDNARDAESKELAETLRSGLTRRVEEEHGKWLAELSQAVKDDRVVRALRVSSHPPKPGSPLPPELATALVAKTMDNLTPETSPERWATVLDALSYSPVHSAVVPAALPSKITDELKAAVAKTATRLPQIAKMFGIEAPSRRPRRKKPAATSAGRTPPPPPPPEPPTATEAPAEPPPPAATPAEPPTATEAPETDSDG